MGARRESYRAIESVWFLGELVLGTPVKLGSHFTGLLLLIRCLPLGWLAWAWRTGDGGNAKLMILPSSMQLLLFLCFSQVLSSLTWNP